MAMLVPLILIFTSQALIDSECTNLQQVLPGWRPVLLAGAVRMLTTYYSFQRGDDSGESGRCGPMGSHRSLQALWAAQGLAH